MRYDVLNAQRISKLNPIVAKKATKLLEQCAAEGLDILINQGLRTVAEQNELYAQGRTKPGQIVTNAKGGYSYHNYGLALDFNLVNPDGSANWTVNAQWKRVAALGKALGFSWGGEWTGSLVDNPHLEYTFGLSINDLLAGKKPPTEEGVFMPTVVKERIYAANSKLVRCDGDYTKPGSDVRYVYFPAGSATMKLVPRKGAKVSALMNEYGADFATNGPFFYNNLILGDAVADGQVISQGYGKMLKWMEFTAKGGVFKIGDQGGTNYDVLAQGSPLLVYEGSAVWDWRRVEEEVLDDIGKSNAQRTVYGVDTKGGLHIAVADGRTKWDKGPSLEEMALYMISKGCWYAINFDGGSSSVLAQKGLGSLGQNQGAAEAITNHAMLIFLKAADPVTPPADWKQEGADWLLANGYLTQAHEKTEAVDIGLLGSMLKNKEAK